MDDHMPDAASETSQGVSGSSSPMPGLKINGLNDSTSLLTSSKLNGLGNNDKDDLFTNDTQRRRTRYRPRTFPYCRYLPYNPDGHESENLETCIKKLYVAVAAGDFIPGATHWTREIRGWMQLKFDLPLDTRVKLVKLYYELALAPGMENAASERFSSMFMQLTK